MKKHDRWKPHNGLTLLEMLLVLVIISSFILFMVNFTTQRGDQLRRDKTSQQIQQIMSSAISYYINNSGWPVSTCGLWQNPATFSTNNFNSFYLYGMSTNPYTYAYSVTCTSQSSSSGGNFYVAAQVDKPINALSIAGSLPMAFINSSPQTTQTDVNCRSFPYTNCNYVIASANIPAQVLNNARSVNFMGLYYPGSCVPAPTCPSGMRASIIVAPAGVTGIGNTNTDNPSCTMTGNLDPSTCNNVNAYPISSFNAYARGQKTTAKPGDPNGTSASKPLDCNPDISQAKESQCLSNDVVGNRNQTWSSSSLEGQTSYWRVCLFITTEQGMVNPKTQVAQYTEAGKIMGQIAAFTRCVPNNGSETPSGSQNVYQYYPYP